MTDEEKKAIEDLKEIDFLLDDVYSTNLIDNNQRNEYQKSIYILENLIEKQQNKIKQQADLLRQQNFIIECDEKTHDYDVKIIDEVKGRAVKYYDVIEDMAKELTNFLEETEEDIIKQFTRGRGL